MTTIRNRIAAWLTNRPQWQQETVARLAFGREFGQAEYEALADHIVSGTNANGGIQSLPDTWSVTKEKPQIAIVQIQIGENVNGLVSGQCLTFPATGLTVVYGDNGSGKSGYARLLKHFCRSRVVNEILPNIFAEENGGPPRAEIDFAVDGQVRVGIDWTQQPESVSHVGFFDKDCSNDYLARDTEVTYRPSELTLLTSLISVCDAVRDVLSSRLEANRRSGIALPQVSPGGQADLFLRGLSVGTSLAEIKDACRLDGEHEQQLAELSEAEARVRGAKQDDVSQRMKSHSADLSLLAVHLETLSDGTDTPALRDADRLADAAAQLRSAATLASAQQFAAEPLPGIGSVAWRALWDAARDYSVQEAYPGVSFPHTGDDAKCVLCQQDLDSDARVRLARFESFVRDQTDERATAAEEASSSARQWILSMIVEPPEVAGALGRLELEHSVTVRRYRRLLGSVSRAIECWGEGGAGATRIPRDTGSLCGQLNREAAHYGERALAMRAEDLDGQLQELAARRLAIEDQVRMAEGQPGIVAEVRRLKVAVAVQGAIRAVSTTGITNLVRDLNRDFVSTAIRDRFQEELNSLKLKTVKLEDKGGQKGRLMQMPAFDMARRPARLSQVLSEGEQTALGLAGFFTEAHFETTASTLILDDPVSSLDHKRRARVAQRLAQLSVNRQTIVFTHDLAFVARLRSATEEVGAGFSERSVERTPDDRPGFISDQHPWRARDTKARFNELRDDLASLGRDWAKLPQRDREVRVSDWSGKLSETLEQAISVEIAARVYDPGTLEVRPLMFRLIGRVTEEDNAEFQEMYGTASGWARRHNIALEHNDIGPDLEELQHELTRASQWFTRIRRYRA